MALVSPNNNILKYYESNKYNTTSFCIVRRIYNDNPVDLGLGMKLTLFKEKSGN